MLDNGQAEAGAAGHLAVALVHAVKALEHALLIRGRNADAVIGHAHKGRAVLRTGFKQHAAIRLVIGDRVVRKVEDHLLECAALARHCHRFARDAERNLVLDRLVLQPVTHCAAQGIQLDRLKRGRVAAFVQLGQTDDVLDQRQQPARLGADFARKRRDVLGPHNAVFHDLGIAHDAGQRRFKLVRDVGGELLPLAFRLVALGDIHHKQHRSVALSVLCD